MSKRRTDAGSTSSWIQTNQGIASCIALVSVGLLIYLVTSEWAYRELRDGFRLGFFTAVAVIAMLICAIVMMIDNHKKDVDDDIAALKVSDWLVALVVLLGCYLYFTVTWQTEFLLVTPVFVAVATYAFGVRPIWMSIAAGLVTTVVIFALFRLIGIELPSRIIGL
jgi:hypothetical protein